MRGRDKSVEHLNHIKGISEVQDVYPRPFNPCQRGVPAKAGSVHLILSKDQKLGRKGEARPHPQHHHPDSVPILSQVLTGHQKSTRSPRAIPQKPHSFHKTKMHTTPSRLFHHTAHTRAHLISCVHNTSSQPHPLHTFVAFPPALQSAQSPGVICLAAATA